jgi:hypothetical protein
LWLSSFLSVTRDETPEQLRDQFDDLSLSDDDPDLKLDMTQIRLHHVEGENFSRAGIEIEIIIGDPLFRWDRK